LTLSATDQSKPLLPQPEYCGGGGSGGGIDGGTPPAAHDQPPNKKLSHDCALTELNVTYA